jgi:UDPglucose 6-dehydrogenase
VEPVCAAIGRGLATRSEYHVVCLTSTVMPGSTGAAVRHTLERESGKRCGIDFGLCYSPEFIALGTVIRDLLNPDMLLIGESDRRAGDVLESLYQRICDNAPPVARMSFVEAEITKLAVNSFITMKITFANLLARISECSAGANVDVITRALGLDGRIGAKYLTGALSYGGPRSGRASRPAAGGRSLQ